MKKPYQLWIINKKLKHYEQDVPGMVKDFDNVQEATKLYSNRVLIYGTFCEFEVRLYKNEVEYEIIMQNQLTEE